MANFFGVGFDTATKIKLHILREYIKEWLPVFIQKREKFWKSIFIYDFFAGEGLDDKGNPGSPSIILNELTNHHEEIVRGKLRLKVFLNDNDPEKIKKLKTNIGTDKRPYELVISERDFTEYFNEIYPVMSSENASRLPRFMFLDQFGIKYVTPDIFQKITSLIRTDFLFFISSSYFKRFAEQDEFQKYLKVTKQDFDGKKAYHCHRVIFEYYKSLLPQKEFYLAPFSLKKDAGNIYGLIFGSNHLLGIEKFMKIAWALDGDAGEANFNIDGAINEGDTLDMFNPDPRAKKLQTFEKDLKEKIRTGSILTLLEVYQYTFEYGCLPKHANDVLKELKNAGLINKKLKLVSSNIHKQVDPNIKLN